MTIYQGYTPPDEKKCPRCGTMHTSQLYLLCDVCREGDELADYFDDPRSEEEREIDKLSEEYETSMQTRRLVGL